MKCLVCEKPIHPGEQIFWGSQMECCGPGEIDCSSSEASDGLMGAIHLSCLEVLSQPAETPGTDAQGGLGAPRANCMCEGEEVVQRSDAMSLLGI